MLSLQFSRQRIEAALNFRTGEVGGHIGTSLGYRGESSVQLALHLGHVGRQALVGGIVGHESSLCGSGIRQQAVDVGLQGGSGSHDFGHFGGQGVSLVGSLQRSTDLVDSGLDGGLRCYQFLVVLHVGSGLSQGGCGLIELCLQSIQGGDGGIVVDGLGVGHGRMYFAADLKYHVFLAGHLNLAKDDFRLSGKGLVGHYVESKEQSLGTKVAAGHTGHGELARLLVDRHDGVLGQTAAVLDTDAATVVLRPAEALGQRQAARQAVDGDLVLERHLDALRPARTDGKFMHRQIRATGVGRHMDGKRVLIVAYGGIQVACVDGIETDVRGRAKGLGRTHGEIDQRTVAAGNGFAEALEHRQAVGTVGQLVDGSRVHATLDAVLVVAKSHVGQSFGQGEVRL